MNTLKTINQWFNRQHEITRFLLTASLLIGVAFIGGKVSAATRSDLGLGVYFGAAFVLIWLRKFV